MIARTTLGPLSLLLTAQLALTGCPDGESDSVPPAEEQAVETDPAIAPGPQPDPGRALKPVEVTDEEIRAADGSVLLRFSDLPGDVPVDDDARFGAGDRFEDASLSPDSEWLAVTTGGVAHGAGWLVQVEAPEPSPAAFQYGGGVHLGPWSPDGRYVVFVQEGPAPTRTLSVVDRDRLRATVTATAIPVRTPAHEDELPAETRYEVTEWRDGQLVFELEGARYRFDPASGEVAALQ